MVRLLFKVALIAGLAVSLYAASAPVRVIFDTDMGNDVDDALALGILHALESRGEAKLLAVTVTKDNPYAAAFVDVIDTFYGRGKIPIGIVKGGKTPRDSPMIRVPSERKKPDGSFVYPRRMSLGAAPDATAVLRQALAQEKDASVVIVQVGFSTNLARLLESRADQISPLTGSQLAAQKVRLLVTMAGHFPPAEPEYNVVTDIPSAQKVFAEWPSPVVFSGFEIGQALLFPARSIEQDFSWVPDHPVVDAYLNYMHMPYDRPTWDLTAALYAVRPDANYFSLSPEGKVRVDEKGNTLFTASAGGKHRYLILDEAAKARTLEALILLASQPRSSVR
jgi:inosine-uridine nucleoside N-ribohydrolase